MTKNEELKHLRSVVLRQKKRIADQEIRILELEADRALFREHFEHRFRWWFQLIRDNKLPTIGWLAENDALWLRRFKYWPMN